MEMKIEIENQRLVLRRFFCGGKVRSRPAAPAELASSIVTSDAANIPFLSRARVSAPPPDRDRKLVPLKVLVPLLKYQQHHDLSTVTLLPSERSAASQSTDESLSLRAVLERVCVRGLGVWHHVSPPPLVSFHHVAERGLEAPVSDLDRSPFFLSLSLSPVS